MLNSGKKIALRATKKIYILTLVLSELIFLNETKNHNPPFKLNDRSLSVLASSAVDREFEPQSGLTKDYKIGICCFSAKHAALRRKNKNWFARNQNNMSEWSDMSTR